MTSAVIFWCDSIWFFFFKSQISTHAELYTGITFHIIKYHIWKIGSLTSRVKKMITGWPFFSPSNLYTDYKEDIRLVFIFCIKTSVHCRYESQRSGHRAQCCFIIPVRNGQVLITMCNQKDNALGNATWMPKMAYWTQNSQTEPKSSWKQIYPQRLCHKK